ncbi:Hypothetical predicted protein [Olea europaea subsp. europaea]|uniref:Uncharacterized protein n=1 Tax=Olea europaea subsp. europaea TaxID=158383 RepID=A0A8S0TXA6_OLEEU|nr:Hypothetical predicted protein [Olea europaea subsp. europaea]
MGVGGGVKSKPLINAFDVESMVALWKHSEFIFVDKLLLANCTVGEAVVVVCSVGQLRKVLQAIVGWCNAVPIRESNVDKRADESGEEHR